MVKSQHFFQDSNSLYDTSEAKLNSNGQSIVVLIFESIQFPSKEALVPAATIESSFVKASVKLSTSE